jgi:hypothetical protein
VSLSFICAPMQDSTKSGLRIRKGTRTRFRLQFGVKERREEYNEKRRGSREEEKEKLAQFSCCARTRTAQPFVGLVVL